ncbi:MAG: DUF805 domain-containing protein [Candidatus Accumulibacter sp.]|jgi:uncharacterized membrane protein YhaH (DUF805 family)|nr:DUF805 domain-containing protein [Accumulibacter sp.]
MQSILLMSFTRIVRALKDAVADALWNTFNLSGRTRRMGFWPYALVYFAVLIVLLRAERGFGYRLPGWAWSAYIVSASAPLVASFFRRWHDIPCPVWKGILGVVSIAVFYVLLFDPLILLVLLYFFIRLSKPSAEANRYGPKPVASLTTLPENRGASPRSADQVLLLLAILVPLGFLTSQRAAFDAFMVRHTPSLSLWSVFDDWMKQSLEEGQNLDVSSLFELRVNKEGKSYLPDEVKWIREETHVILMTPGVSIENVVCPGHSQDFVARLGVHPSSLYDLIAFDSSGLLYARKLNASRFCKERFSFQDRRCLELSDAVFIASSERGPDDKSRACFRPVLASKARGY